jgi:hypothetical protein
VGSNGAPEHLLKDVGNLRRALASYPDGAGQRISVAYQSKELGISHGRFINVSKNISAT